MSKWTRQDEKNLCDLCFLMNVWQDGKSYQLLPYRAYEMRQWLKEKFPQAHRWREPRVPVENMTWEQWKECQEHLYDDE